MASPALPFPLDQQLDGVHGLAQVLHAALAPPPDAIELGVALTDKEARSLGLPCVGAHRACVGMVAARLKRPVRIVPRGSTLATQIAAKEHGR